MSVAKKISDAGARHLKRYEHLLKEALKHNAKQRAFATNVVKKIFQVINGSARPEELTYLASREALIGSKSSKVSYIRRIAQCMKYLASHESIMIFDRTFKIASIRFKTEDFTKITDNKLFRIDFITPTHLSKIGSKFDTVFPEPVTVFSNLMRIWDTCMQEKFGKENHSKYKIWAEKYVTASAYDLYTMTVFGKGMKIGFIRLSNYRIDDDKSSDLAYAWNNKGYALNSLGKYGEAIKCFDNAVSIYQDIKRRDDGNADLKKSAEDITYLRKGQSEYMLDDYISALVDFRKINEDNSNLIGDKHNNIGLCYYKQHKFKQAEQEYIKATDSSSKSTIANAYYNLAVLYNSEGRRDKARRMFENCLKSNPNFSKAKETLSKLEGSSDQPLEWYSWWFNHVKGKKALGILLISSMLAPLLIVSLTVYHVYFVTRNFGELTSFIDHNLSVLITAVITIMGLSIAVLLLPSLTKIKVGSIVELETLPTIHTKSNGIELEAFSTIPSLISVSMPTEIPLESFRMPLQSLRMPTKYPLKSTRMTLQSFNHP